MSNAVTQAEGFVQSGHIQDAVAALHEAERQGDAAAARELALWCLAGAYVRRNLAQSRAYFERAAQLGDAASAAVSRAFIASGVGGPADWPRAMQLLQAAAATDHEAAAQLKLIDAMPISPEGEPSASFPCRPLSQSPEVWLFPSLFTPAECKYLIGTAGPRLQPSVVIDPYTGRETPNPIRTSSGTGFPFVDENPAIHALNRRLAAASKSDVRAGEPLQILRYAPGQQYREHNDALPGVAPDQQRVLTFLVYLDDDYEGGETAFPAIGLKVRGRQGDGLLFRNAGPDGAPDPRATHAGLPVTRGVKHVASRWIRAAPLDLG